MLSMANSAFSSEIDDLNRLDNGNQAAYSLSMLDLLVLLAHLLTTIAKIPESGGAKRAFQIMRHACRKMS